MSTVSKSLLISLFFVDIGVGYSALPITLSSPVPSITTSMYAGDTALKYVYTLTNTTQRSIGVEETVTGNSTSVTISSACAKVPPKGSCTFTISVAPKWSDINSGINDSIAVNWDGRLPHTLTSSVNVTVGEPTLSSISVAPTSTGLLSGGSLQYTAIGSFNNNSNADITSLATWSSSSPSIASIGANSGTVLGLTAGTTNITAAYHSVTSNTAVLTVSDFAFIPNYNNGAGTTISSCLVAANGNLGLCNTNNGFNAPYAVVLNRQGNIAYVSNAGTNQVLACAVNLSTGLLSSCSSVFTASGTLAGIALDHTDTYIYISDTQESTITTCTLNQTTGGLGSCTIRYGINYALNASLLNLLGYAYLVGTDQSAVGIFYCLTNPDVGTISTCYSTGIENNSSPGIATNYAGTYLYYTTGSNNSVMYCALETSNGRSYYPTNCTNTNNANVYSNPNGVSIRAGDNMAYISNSGSNQISACPINLDGSFGTCTAQVTIGTVLSGPQLATVR